jgi:hypothetical protein
MSAVSKIISIPGFKIIGTFDRFGKISNHTQTSSRAHLALACASQSVSCHRRINCRRVLVEIGYIRASSLSWPISCVLQSLEVRLEFQLPGFLLQELPRCQFEQERRPLIELDHGQSESTIDSLKKEIEPLKQGFQFNDGFSEIDRIEKRIREIEMELEHSFTVDSVPLSRLLQLRTTQTDLKSYLRGLKYCVGKSATESTAAVELSLQS